MRREGQSTYNKWTFAALYFATIMFIIGITLVGVLVEAGLLGASGGDYIIIIGISFICFAGAVAFSAVLVSLFRFPTFTYLDKDFHAELSTLLNAENKKTYNALGFNWVAPDYAFWIELHHKNTLSKDSKAAEV